MSQSLVAGWSLTSFRSVPCTFVHQCASLQDGFWRIDDCLDCSVVGNYSYWLTVKARVESCQCSDNSKCFQLCDRVVPLSSRQWPAGTVCNFSSCCFCESTAPNSLMPASVSTLYGLPKVGYDNTGAVVSLFLSSFKCTYMSGSKYSFSSECTVAQWSQQSPG